MMLSQNFFELEASPVRTVEGESLQQKAKKRRKRKGTKKILKIEKPEDVGHFLTCRSKNVIKSDASGKKGMSLHCKCHFEWIGANVAHFQAENLKNLKKCVFDEKLQESVGFKKQLIDCVTFIIITGKVCIVEKIREFKSSKICACR